MISILVALVFLGVALYLIALIPMDPTVRTIIRVLAILFVVIWLLQAVGLWSGFGNVRLR